MIHRTKENKDEVTDDIVVNMLQDKLELEILKKDIVRDHRIERLSPRKKRPIIVKFVRYNDSHKVYSNKKRLKDSGTSITRSLTAYRLGQLNKSWDERGFQNVWTHDGKILFKENDSNSTKLFYG